MDTIIEFDNVVLLQLSIMYCATYSACQLLLWRIQKILKMKVSYRFRRLNCKQLIQIFLFRHLVSLIDQICAPV